MDTFYLIRYVEEEISVSLYEKSKFDYLKNRGEEQQPYNALNFWEWFREKIEYDGEELKFIVISDKEEFQIPESIAIASEHQVVKEMEVHLSRMGQNLNIFSYPKIEIKSIQDTKKAIPREAIMTSDDSIANHFRKKTKAYTYG